jgi:hypothetical protein
MQGRNGDTTMNLREGTRRLALLLGVVGAILGGVASYLELQSIFEQEAHHDRFEELENSDVVQFVRKNIQEAESADPFADIAEPATDADKTSRSLKSRLSQVPPPAKFDLSRARVCPIDTGDASGCWTDVNKGGVKTIHWAKGKELVVESIETEDGRRNYPTPQPSRWHYLFAAILPLLGFILPWGLIRAITWVVSGFAASGV